jgi:hypothetical protein
MADRFRDDHFIPWIIRNARGARDDDIRPCPGSLLCHERQLFSHPQVPERDGCSIAAVAFNAPPLCLGQEPGPPRWRHFARTEHADKLGQRHNAPRPGCRLAVAQGHRHIRHHRSRHRFSRSTSASTTSPATGRRRLPDSRTRGHDAERVCWLPQFTFHQGRCSRLGLTVCLPGFLDPGRNLADVIHHEDLDAVSGRYPQAPPQRCIGAIGTARRDVHQ